MLLSLVLLKPIVIFVAKVATATMVVSAVGYVVCKVIDYFANSVATRTGCTRFFVKVFKISWETVKMVAKALDGTTIDTTTAPHTEFTTDIQDQLDDGPMTYEYSN